ncbi:orexin receptor type 2 [Patella vulgata]|uniref:orexin receptor type 2 n=1 Tax=Patella vulgata TaxID=6465 RepID=UPI00217F2C1F|nr:orexin receptor type 2 [Patella vulgata]
MEETLGNLTLIGNGTFNNTLNGTDEDNVTCWNEYCWDIEEYEDHLNQHIFPKWQEWIVVVLYFLTFVLGVVGNFLVVFAVWRNHNMRTVTNIYIVNLAVGDFLVISLCLTPTLVQDITYTWFLGTTMCKILLFLQNVSVSVSVLTLGAISMERWYAICHPLSFKSTLSRARNTIIIIWTVSCSVALPELIVADTFGYSFPKPFTSILLTSCAPSWLLWVQFVYQIALMIAMYLFPLILMGITYANIAYVLWRKEIPGEIAGRKSMIDGKGHNQEDKLQSRRKAAKMLITIVIVFALCYLPVHLVNILRYVGALKNLSSDAATLQSLITHWLPYFNSSINPVIYNFMSAKFRKEFKSACFCFVGVYYRQPFRRPRGETFTMTFSQSNYSNCHTEEVTMSSFKD